MSRRDVQLQQMREQRLVETTSRIYASTVAEVLFEAGLPKEDIESVSYTHLDVYKRQMYM